MDDSDESYREPKRRRTQGFRYNHDYITPTSSGPIPSPLGAEDDIFAGLENVPDQNNLCTNSSGHFEPQCAADLPYFGSNTPGSGISMEGFPDGRPFNIVNQLDSEPNIPYLLDSTRQEAVTAQEESNIIKKGNLQEDSVSPGLCDNYASVPLQFNGDSPLDLDGDEKSQKRWEPMNQASEISASESVPRNSITDRYNACFGVVRKSCFRIEKLT